MAQAKLFKCGAHSILPILMAVEHQETATTCTSYLPAERSAPLCSRIGLINEAICDTIGKLFLVLPCLVQQFAKCVELAVFKCSLDLPAKRFDLMQRIDRPA